MRDDLLIHKSGVVYRPGGGDIRIIGELSSYRALDPQPGDFFLDVGGFIGFVARWLRSHGSRVLSFEPYPESYDLLQINSPHSKDNFCAALVRGTAPSAVTLYENTGKDTSCHSLVPRRGRREISVSAVSFEEVLANHPINKIKMDCEGYEYALLADPLPKKIRMIAVELHMTRSDWRRNAQETHAALLRQGFSTVRDPSFSPKNWNAFGIYGR